MVAIVGLLAATTIPVFSRSLAKSHRNAFAAEAGVLYGAFKQYYIDYGRFPSDDGAFGDTFDPATLAPLTTDGHMSAGAAMSFLGKQLDDEIFIYVTPDIRGPDTDLLIGMHPKYDTSEWVYIFHTDVWVEEFGHLDGVYFYRNEQLIPADQVVD